MINIIFDNMELKEILSIVDKVNKKLEDIENLSGMQIGLSTETSYYYCSITFCSYVLWDSVSQTRRYIDVDKQEPLIECISRRLNEFIKVCEVTGRACNLLAEEFNKEVK